MKTWQTFIRSIPALFLALILWVHPVPPAPNLPSMVRGGDHALVADSGSRKPPAVENGGYDFVINPAWQPPMSNVSELFRELERSSQATKDRIDKGRQ